MASLTIRNIPDDIQRRFRAQASAKGRSMEAEARNLVIAAVSEAPPEPRKSIRQMIYDMSRPGFDIPELPEDRPALAPSSDWVNELVSIANGAGEGVFERERQPVREFDL